MGRINMESGRVKIRKYEEADHDRVCRLFYDGMIENGFPAYRSLVTRPGHLLQHVLLLTLVIYFTSSMFWITCTEIVLHLAFMGLTNFLYWQYATEHLNSDMKDSALCYWTGYGENTGGFYVAEVDGEVVGTVAYIRINDTTLELHRVSVDVRLRQKRLAQQLVERIENVAATLGVNTLKAETSSFQTAAIKFYDRTGWRKVSSNKYPGHFLHGVRIVTFYKDIQGRD